MEPLSLVVGAAVGAGALHFLGGKKKATPRKRSTTAKKKAVPRKKAAPVKKAVAKKPVAKKAVAKKKPAKKKVENKPKVVSAKNRQTGSSKTNEDKSKQAMKPGKRVSANGNTYYERRRNRSDVGKLLGTVHL
jgi:outer membrane biosynthesis protein TonB